MRIHPWLPHSVVNNKVAPPASLWIAILRGEITVACFYCIQPGSPRSRWNFFKQKTSNTYIQCIYIYIPIHENTRAFFKGGYFPISHNPQVWSVSFKQPRSGLGDMILLMGSEILHRLRLVVYPIIYRVSYIQTVVVWDFWTINSMVVEYDQKPYQTIIFQRSTHKVGPYDPTIFSVG